MGPFYQRFQVLFAKMRAMGISKEAIDSSQAVQGLSQEFEKKFGFAITANTLPTGIQNQIAQEKFLGKKTAETTLSGTAAKIREVFSAIFPAFSSKEGLAKRRSEFEESLQKKFPGEGPSVTFNRQQALAEFDEREKRKGAALQRFVPGSKSFNNWFANIPLDKLLERLLQIQSLENVLPNAIAKSAEENAKLNESLAETKDTMIEIANVAGGAGLYEFLQSLSAGFMNGVPSPYLSVGGAGTSGIPSNKGPEFDPEDNLGDINKNTAEIAAALNKGGGVFA
jgi:hypothetical protein